MTCSNSNPTNFPPHMLALNISGNRSTGVALVGALRDIPARVLPYAGATAATRVAKIAASKTLPDEMRRVFKGPVAWTLNSLRVIPATVANPVARVFVKDDAPRNGTRPEDYLLPEVEGGPRKEKRFERALRYGGLLPAGWRAMPGQGAKLDANGNFKRGEMQRILTATRTAFDPAQRKTTSARSKRNARNAPYFGITPFTGKFAGGEYQQKASKVTPGVYRRNGKGIIPVLIFTKTQPVYRKRLDFAGVVERTAQAHFPEEFARAAREITDRRK